MFRGARLHASVYTDMSHGCCRHVSATNAARKGLMTWTCRITVLPAAYCEHQFWGMSSLWPCRLGRADVVARVLVELDEQRQVQCVVQALQGLKTEDAVEAAVQVSQALASMDRPDIVADVRSSAGPLIMLTALPLSCRTCSQHASVMISLCSSPSAESQWPRYQAKMRHN